MNPERNRQTDERVITAYPTELGYDTAVVTYDMQPCFVSIVSAASHEEIID